VRIAIRVRPGSARDEVGGSHADALVVRVRERAAQGRATAAALAVLAKALAVPRRSVRLVAGSTSRTKIVELPDAAAARVEQLLQTPPATGPG
jgi:uncharacterized protein YggU (UPF0235/DUF167 family)